MTTRKCTKCGEEKPETAEYYHRNKNCRGGLHTICKECKSKADKRRRAENPEKEREKSRRWYAGNSEKKREASRRWRAENPEKARERSRRWRAENPEKAREQSRRWRAKNPEKKGESNRRWRAENPEKAREQVRRWQAENPEKVRESGRRWRDTLAPKYIKQLISAKYSIDRSEIGDELINAKRRELIYYRQLTHLKNQQNETK